MAHPYLAFPNEYQRSPLSAAGSPWGGLRAGGGGAPDALSIPALIAKYGSLFTLYDPSNLAAQWQDLAGTTPIVVDAQVGRASDLATNANPVTQGGGARPTLRTGGGLYWWEFDGVDDTLLGAAAGYAGVGATHFIACAASRPTEVNASIFAAFVSASEYSRIRSIATSARATADYRNATGNFSINTATNGFPVSINRVLDSLAKPGYLDIAVNGANATAATTTTDLDGLAAAQVVIGATTMMQSFYGGIMLKAEPTVAERAFIRQYLAGKAGITF